MRFRFRYLFLLSLHISKLLLQSIHRVLLLSKPDRAILAALVDCLPYLASKGLEVYVEESVFEEIKELNLAREKASINLDCIESNGVTVNDNDSLDEEFRLKKNKKHNTVLNLFHKELPRSQGVDLVIAFGGDGLLMHCNTLFGGGSIPPSMCFDFGSLGFLAPFDYKDFQEEVILLSLYHPLILFLRTGWLCAYCFPNLLTL